MEVANRKLSWQAIGRAVRGALHRRTSTPLQDAIRWAPAGTDSGCLVLTLADGHGWPLSLRSRIGAEIAVETTVQLLKGYYSRHSSCQESELQHSAEEQIPKELISRWRQAVARDLEKHPFTADELESLGNRMGPSAQRALEADPVLAYGSTVLGALATSSFVLLLQLGDGDLLVVSSDGETRRPWPRDPRLLGVETTSLCMPEAWKEVRLGVQKVSEQSPELLLLCTDGYSNSFREEEGFLNVGRDFLQVLRSEGVEKVNDSLEQWLTETTESGSGDDVTVGLLWRRGVSPSELGPSGSELTH